jgi:hypothetical protein
MSVVVWLIIFFDVVCGVLAYGLWKGGYREHYQQTHQYANPKKYGFWQELVCLWFFLMGPIGLLVALIVRLFWGLASACFPGPRVRFLSVCFRMPKEFCKKEAPC